MEAGAVGRRSPLLPFPWPVDGGLRVLLNYERVIQMPKPPFTRGRKTRGCTDNVGTVIISMCMKKSGVFVKGSLSRTFTIHDVKVSDVVDVIKEALFGKEG